jgi:ribosome-associated protein
MISPCKQGVLQDYQKRCSLSAPRPAASISFTNSRHHPASVLFVLILTIFMLDTPQLSSLAISTLNQAKALDIKLIDVRNMTDITDRMIICHGTSDRHALALARNLMDALSEQDTRPASIEGEDLGEWILIDYIDVLVHIMKRETREYYDLESLWDNRLATHDEQRNVKSA